MIVYWIRETGHTDIFTQGYVGITSMPLSERVRSHKKNKGNSIVSGKLRKYQNLVAEEVHEELSLREALGLEEKYRPTQNIGWNLQKGGELGVEPSWYDIPENKQKHSEKTSVATRRGIASKDTTQKRSERARLSRRKNSKSYEGLAKGSKNPRAILDEEDVFLIKYWFISEGVSNKTIAQVFGVKPYVISFIRTGKNWKDV